jgi:A/G-specific adenine glycosylase
MLQQTRVAAVVPYFERFLRRFPDIRSLAAASLDEVLAHWSGLGYYRRARHLKRAAEAIARHHGGEVPRDREALLALPGVGRYTAGAVLSIAFDRRAAVLDGNVFRVYSRFFARKGSWDETGDRTAFWELAEDLVPERRPGDFNQALMELGALVCVPREPDCPHCPVRARCAARLGGEVDRYPSRRVRPETETVRRRLYIVEDAEGRILLERRPEGGRMAGLWDLPSAPGGRGRRVGAFRHSVLHLRYAVTVYRAPAARGGWGASGGKDRRFVAREELASYALTAMARKAIETDLRSARDPARR